MVHSSSCGLWTWVGIVRHDYDHVDHSYQYLPDILQRHDQPAYHDRLQNCVTQLVWCLFDWAPYPKRWLPLQATAGTLRAMRQSSNHLRSEWHWWLVRLQADWHFLTWCWCSMHVSVGIPPANGLFGRKSDNVNSRFCPAMSCDHDWKNFPLCPCCIPCWCQNLSPCCWTEMM